MLDRELTYQMPFERLLKLSRSASRKAFAYSWYFIWALAAAYFIALFLIITFSDAVSRWQADLGVPDFSAIVLAALGVFVGIWLLRRYGRKQMKGRVDYDGTVRFREEADGLRVATPQIEYYVKWNGISQMLLETDGVVFSHGNLFFMVPDTAFATLDERNTLIRDVFGRLSASARERSETFIRPVLDASAITAGS